MKSSGDFTRVCTNQLSHIDFQRFMLIFHPWYSRMLTEYLEVANNIFLHAHDTFFQLLCQFEPWRNYELLCNAAFQIGRIFLCDIKSCTLLHFMIYIFPVKYLTVLVSNLFHSWLFFTSFSSVLAQALAQFQLSFSSVCLVFFWSIFWSPPLRISTAVALVPLLNTLH